MALETWLAFFVACWIISLSPGAGAIASMSAGLQYGFLRGYWNALGLQLGLVLQIVIVAAGVGAILAASELAFSLIKWFGVLYLVYLGYRQWQALPSDMATQTERPIGRPLTLVLRGFLVNFSNPKAIVFMLAVLPQFLNPQAPLLMQYLVMGVTHDLRRSDCHGGLHRLGGTGAGCFAFAASAEVDEPHLRCAVRRCGCTAGECAPRSRLIGKLILTKESAGRPSPRTCRFVQGRAAQLAPASIRRSSAG
jgi:homoserine/homoserine lactone efflux protein